VSFANHTIIYIRLLTLSVIFGLDYLYYSKVTLTPLNFVLTNVTSVSLFYGSSPWHYYIFQALPILCTTSLPFVLHSAYTTLSNRKANAADKKLKILLGCIGWTIGIYSMGGHKEWRFLHPLLPLLHVLASKSLVDAYQGGLHPTQKAQMKKTKTRPLIPIRTGHLWLILLTVPASIYVMLFHCSAQISVMSYLRNVPPRELRSVGFLMPCHSTPWQAYLHRPDLAGKGRLWALGCEPPLGHSDLTTYKDQADVFYDSPMEYIRQHFPAEVDTTFPPSPFPSSIPGAVVQSANGEPWRHTWPQFLVMFGDLLADQGVRLLLETKGYGEVWSAGWGWEGEGKRKGGVKVWKYLK
jgi:phosphatidylinositol glycan class B